MVFILPPRCTRLVSVLFIKLKKYIVMKKIIKYIIVVLVFTGSSCSDDFLERIPEDAVTIDNFYRTPEELRMGTAPLYNQVWFDWHDKAKIGIGDASSGVFSTNDGAFRIFMQFSVTADHARMNEAWRSLFNVVAQSNMLIYGVKNSTSDQITEAHKNLAIAEARFMRAVAYMNIVANWGPVPIIESNLAYVENYVIPTNRVEDIYQFIINDLDFAAEWLLEADRPGRVTQWSAKGMLARAHLYAAGVGQTGSRDPGHLNKARAYAVDVIENSPNSLMEEYADLYKLENNNNSESLFSLQWVDKGALWGVQNTLQAYFAHVGRLTGVGDGWGGTNGATPFMQSLYEENDQRRKPTFMYHGDHYPELLRAEGGYTYEGTSSAGSAVKKYVIGRPEDNPGHTLSFMSTPQNTYMMRLAEVHLIAAEAILGDAASTSDANALRYYNAIRERAGLPLQGSITFDDIFREKFIELAVEGRNWHELVRWHYFDSQGAINYVSGQNRGYYSWSDGVRQDPDPPVYITPTDDSFRFPYPSAEISRNPLLTQEPVPFDF